MKKFISEFKEFALKGNMLDLAIGVIIGTSFNAVVTSIVNDIIMPLVGIIIGGHDFSKLVLKVGEATVNYGIFLQNLVNLFIVAFSLFVVVKAMNALKRKKETPQEEPKPAEKPEDIKLLEEIRDSIVALNNK